MNDLPIEERVFFKKSKWLVHALIVSLTLNCALIATLCFFALEKNQVVGFGASETGFKKKAKSAPETIASQLKAYFHENISMLIKELRDQTPVEEGQKRCDLALSCLVLIHQFDLERALPGISIEKREVAFSLEGKEVHFPLFVGLSPSSYVSICRFAEGEVYPYTPERIFNMVKVSFPDCRKDLKATFFHSSEFHFIERALIRAGFKGEKEDILQLLIHGTWDTIKAFSTELRSSKQGRFESLGSFLTYFIELEEPLAAQLLIELDQEYAIKRLNNIQFEKVLSLAKPSSEIAQTFFEKAARGLRSDRLQSKAAQALSPEENLEKKESPRYPDSQVYVVLPGDTLWKIASRYGITISEIKKENSLHSSLLFAGQILKIPSNVVKE